MLFWRNFAHQLCCLKQNKKKTLEKQSLYETPSAKSFGKKNELVATHSIVCNVLHILQRHSIVETGHLPTGQHPRHPKNSCTVIRRPWSGKIRRFCNIKPWRKQNGFGGLRRCILSMVGHCVRVNQKKYIIRSLCSQCGAKWGGPVRHFDLIWDGISRGNAIFGF